jgi:hypothetical protein
VTGESLGVDRGSDTRGLRRDKMNAQLWGRAGWAELRRRVGLGRMECVRRRSLMRIEVDE